MKKIIQRYIRAIFCAYVALINCSGGIILLLKDDRTYGTLLIASAAVAVVLAVLEFHDAKED